MEDEYRDEGDGRMVSGPLPLRTDEPSARFGVFLALGLISVVLISGTAAFLLTRGGGSSDDAARAPNVASPTPTTTPNPLEQEQLQGLADTIAKHLNQGDTEVAEFIVLNARDVTNCAVTAFTGGRGGASLADPAERDFVTRDADDRGWDIAFGHKAKTWIVLAQLCEGRA